jgi:hypothetical protein
MLRYWPDSPDDWYPRYQVRLLESRWDDALAILQEPVASQVMSSDDIAQARAFLEAAKSGSPIEREKVRQATLAAAANGRSPTDAIFALAALGYIDDAFAVAERYEPGQALTGEGAFVLFTPAAAPMRRDPRFLKLAERLGLLALWRQSGKWPDLCQDPKLTYRCV